MKIQKNTKHPKYCPYCSIHLDDYRNKELMSLGEHCGLKFMVDPYDNYKILVDDFTKEQKKQMLEKQAEDKRK